jgi:molybdate transport system regulatory protein
VYKGILIAKKTSARNLIRGKIIRVETDKIMAKVVVEIQPATVTSIITKESVEDLDLKAGNTVKVIVKSNSVIIVKE